MNTKFDWDEYVRHSWKPVIDHDEYVRRLIDTGALGWSVMPPRRPWWRRLLLRLRRR